MAIEYRFKLRRRISSSADPTDLLHGEMASVEPTGGFWYGWGAGTGDLADENRLLFCSDGTRLWHDVVGASDGTTEFVGDGAGISGVIADAVEWDDVASVPVAVEALGALTPANNRLAYYTGASTAALATLTAAGRALLDDANAAAQRTTLGLGNVDNTADASKVVASAAVWTTARTLTVGDSGKSVNGSGNVAWSLAEIGAVPDEILYGPMTVGGSADAITLTTGAGLSAIPRNLTLWFRATSANTGATTINIDGIGAVACRTVSGAVLPSGYIRTDVQTPFWYDGTNIIVGRLPEIVTTSSVRAVKQADGNMVCETIIDMTADAWTTAAGAFFVSASGGASVTFGVAFAAVPALQCMIQRGSATQICGCWASNVTTSGAAIRPFSNSSIAGGVTKTIHVTATGRWY